MLSGRRLDLLDPTPVDVEVEDIAHGLAFVARWNGQTRGDWPYSVAEHSLLVEEIFAADHDLKRAMREPMRAHESAQEKLEGTLRGRLKHVQEGTAQWEIEYRRLREEVERRRRS